MRWLSSILIIFFYCHLANALPNGICKNNSEDNIKNPYFGPDSEYYEDWSDFHWGWYDPSSLTQLYLLYSNQKYGVCGDWCDSIAEDNVEQIAQDFLWERIITDKGTKWQSSCGGDATCLEPRLASNVQCYVEQADCDFTFDEGCNAPYFKLTRVFSLECRGDSNCLLEHKSSKECCIITKIKEIKPSVKQKQVTKQKQYSVLDYQKCVSKCNIYFLTDHKQDNNKFEEKIYDCKKKCPILNNL